MCNPATNGFTPTETYVLGQAGEQLTTYTWSGTQSTWARNNVYGEGKLLATYDAVGVGLHFQLTDHLGTRRVQTDPSGTPETDCQSLPYGDGLNCFAPAGAPATGASGDDATPLHFTGKQRDIESGNDYFGARYYASAAGRFMSPDWSVTIEPVPYSKLDDPQTLNLYAYVKNNPISGVDPNGHSTPGLERFGCSDGEVCDGQSQIPYDSLSAAVRDAAAEGGTPQDGKAALLNQIYAARQAQQQNTNNSAPAHFEYSISTGELWKVDASGNATAVDIGYSGKGNSRRRLPRKGNARALETPLLASSGSLFTRPGILFTDRSCTWTPHRFPIELSGTMTDTVRVIALGWFCAKEINEDDRITFDATSRDYYGMPKMSIEYSLTARDRELVERAKREQLRAVEQLGEPLHGQNPEMIPASSSLHYQGTTRMGDDPGISVCDSDARVWGFSNLFVGGNGVIPTSTACNPTLTTVALAIHACQAVLRATSS
jgi:RHS repeat-associated protein